MNLYRSFLILFATLAVACSHKVSETTLIHGHIEGGDADKVTVFVWDYDIQNEEVDILDGSFSYELATNPAVVATITCYMDGKRVSQPVIPDGSELFLVFSPDGAGLNSSNKKSVNYRMLEVDALYDKVKEHATQILALQQSGASKEQIDSLMGTINPVNERLIAMYQEDLDEQKDNYLSVQGLVSLQSRFTDEQVDSLINTLDPSVIQTIRVQTIRKDIQGRLATREGKTFVDFAGENGDARLSDYVGKGKYILTDFWASWCQPCIVEIPHLKELYEKYNGDTFTILGIACSDNPENSKAAISKHSMPWAQILGTGMVAMETYGFNGIPYYILFAPDGTILKRGLRGEALDNALKEILEK